MADLTSLYADRASLGTTDTQVPVSPLRLGPLPAPTGAPPRLAIDAAGNVTAGVLTVADLPLGSDWTWASGKTITFAPGPLAPPAATSRSLGTRLVLEPVPGSTEYAIGRATSELWTSIPVGLDTFTWYVGTTRVMRLGFGSLELFASGASATLGLKGPSGGQIMGWNGVLALTSMDGPIHVSSYTGQILPASGYTQNLGSLTRKYLTLHAAELWVETLVAQETLATIGGRILVGPTTTLVRDVAAADTQIYVKHNIFQINGGGEFGSHVVLQVGGKFEILQVRQDTPASFVAAVPGTNAPGWLYQVFRNADGSGANDWAAGDAVFDTGKYTDGVRGAFIDLYSVNGVRAGSTAGPTIVGNVRTGYNATDWREHWAIGNLQGVYGNSTRKFGVAFGDTNATHVQIDSTDGFTIRGAGGVAGGILGQWSMTNVVTLGFGGGGSSNIVLDPNDGTLRMKAAGVDKIVLRADGTADLAAGLMVGTTLPGSVAYIRSVNALDWNNGRGFFFKYTKDSDMTSALIGRTAGPKRCLQWDGLSLKLTSDGLVIDENGITMTQNDGTTVEPGKLIRFGTSGGYLWDTTAGGGQFAIVRQTGTVTVAAKNGPLGLGAEGPGAGTSAFLTLFPSYIEVNGVASGGLKPVIRPATDAEFDLGQVARRWQNVYTTRVQMAAAYSPYQLELQHNQAVKPTSSTWLVKGIDALTDRHVVDPDDAVARLRRVPVRRGAAGIGVVAAELAAVLPDSVSARPDDGTLLWDAHELFMLNVVAVQALAARLDALERIRPS